MGAAKKLVILLAGYTALTKYPWAVPAVLAFREVLSYYESVSEASEPATRPDPEPTQL